MKKLGWAVLPFTLVGKTELLDKQPSNGPTANHEYLQETIL